MSERGHYPAGVPCWTSVMARDVVAARGFYEELFRRARLAGPEGADFTVSQLVVSPG